VQPVQIVWFKKDLRVRDHAPLRGAAARGPVLPLYIYEPEQLGHEEFGGHHLSYLNNSLSELDAALRQLGAPLVIRVGEAVQVLETLSHEMQIGALWAHEETGNGLSFARDRRVRTWARSRGLPFHELPQNGVVRRLKDRGGWAATWEERMTAPPSAVPARLQGTQIESQGLRTPAELNVPASTKSIPTGGSFAAQATLHSFLTVRGVNYMREMSSPLSAETACSRLSAPLAFGTVSLREVVQATRQRLAAVKGDPQADPRWVRSLRSYESRLHWHCHFMQRLESEPRMEFENLNHAFDGLREPHWNQDSFDRWAHGQTGFPLIDACVRMLRETGWLNFRMRAMLVSFASQHLWLHWRPTGLFLARQWLDNESGVHWSQMQMQSSTVGINRVRIYSPTRQAKEQDPDGTFIRRWVPELADAPGDFLHAPWLWSGAGRLGYPAPIVDEAKAGRAARARITAARAGETFEAESRRVYLKHGSRKKAEIRADRVARGLPARPVKAPPRAKVHAAGAAQPLLFSSPAISSRAPVPIRNLPDDWRSALEQEFSAPYFHNLSDFVRRERAEQTVYPPAPDVLSALRLTPLSEVKVLILGQDPYHGAGQAHGLSFSVRPGVRVPPSLANIYRELQQDVGFEIPRHGFLDHWAQQGVLMLNSVLTVRAGQPNSHANQGWETFTGAVIEAINARPERVVALLWGAAARKKAKLIRAPQHVVLTSAHPSPLSAEQFFGNRHFSKANAALEEAGLEPVNWQLPSEP
jgi:deoxyribodipyrimidine photo-lyase